MPDTFLNAENPIHIVVRTQNGEPFVGGSDEKEADIRRQIEIDREEVTKELRNLEIRDPFYQEVARSAHTDLLLKAYSQKNGLIPPGPRCFVVPTDAKGIIDAIETRHMSMNGLSKGNRGLFIPAYNIAIVFSTGDKVLDAKNIHHELNHGISMMAEINFDNDKKRGRVMGFRTITRKGLVRGGALEEGLMVYESHNYIEGRFKDDFPGEYQSFLAKSHMDFPTECSDEEVVASALRLSESIEYDEACRMVEQLIEGVKKHHSLGQIFEHLLLSARLRPGRRREVLETVDAVFGAGTTRRIFQTKINSFSELLALSSSLR